MKRTVHRLQPKLRLFKGGRRKHRVGVIQFMTAHVPELAFGNVRRVYKAIIMFDQFAAQILLHLLADDSPFWMPQDQPLPVLLLNGKEVELATESTMIAAFRFLALLQPRI